MRWKGVARVFFYTIFSLLQYYNMYDRNSKHTTFYSYIIRSLSVSKKTRRQRDVQRNSPIKFLRLYRSRWFVIQVFLCRCDTDVSVAFWFTDGKFFFAFILSLGRDRFRVIFLYCCKDEAYYLIEIPRVYKLHADNRLVTSDLVAQSGENIPFFGANVQPFASNRFAGVFWF